MNLRKQLFLRYRALAFLFIAMVFLASPAYALRNPAHREAETQEPFRVNLRFDEGPRLYDIRSDVALEPGVQDEVDGMLDVIIREQHHRYLWTLQTLAETVGAFLWLTELQGFSYARANIELSPDEWDLVQFIKDDCQGSWRDPGSQKRTVVEYTRHARWWPREVAVTPRTDNIDTRRAS